jgi:NAD(P)-dependent dehydrogenase (short-subunit alcohol dehydrogenase family)
MASERVALVVGASRGIGRGCARQLALAGFDVAVAARTVEEGSAAGGLPGSLDAVVAEIESTESRALACRMDLLDRESCVAAIDRTLDEFGRIDVLVNSGIDYGDGMGLFADTPIETYDRAFSVNVVAPLFLIQKVLPAMRKQGRGIVVNISSGAGQNETRDLPGAGGWPLLYSVTKAAINRATAGLAKELRGENIAVINLEPGVVATERMVMVTSQQGIEHGVNGVNVDVPGAVCAYIARHSNPMSFSGRTVDAPQFCVWAGLVDGTSLPFPYGPEAWGAPPEVAVAGQTTGVGGGVPRPPETKD